MYPFKFFKLEDTVVSLAKFKHLVRYVLLSTGEVDKVFGGGLKAAKNLLKQAVKIIAAYHAASGEF
jgi:hypothetical protein